MVGDDLEYYERRAEAEIQMACNASQPNVVKAHYEMANAYLERIYGEPDPQEA